MNLALLALLPAALLLDRLFGELPSRIHPVCLMGALAARLETLFRRGPNNALMFLSGTLACLLVGYPFAYRIARASAKWKPWLLLLVIIPFWTNSLIRTYALILILKANGLISALLVWLGITDRPISLMYGEFAVFMGILYTFLPFMVLPLYASIEKLDSRLLDAARDLGASGFQSFWHVTLPLTLPGIIAGSMLVFLPSLGAFYIPEILGGAKSMLIGNFIKNQFMVARDWPLGAAASTILTLLLALLIIVYRIANRKVARDRTDEVA